MIPTSDLRPGNLIQTEYGILPVHAIAFNDIQVMGSDGRILWAKKIEGVEITESHLKNISDNDLTYFLVIYQFLHELQNYFYWNYRIELDLN